MATNLFDPVAPTKNSRAKRVSRKRAPRPDPKIGRLAIACAIAGFVLVMALGVAAESRPDLHVRGGLAIFLGGMAGLAGMYLALIMLLLISRIPILERILGQDGMVRWHRRLGPWPLSLIVVHAIVITLGFAESARAGLLHELWSFVDSYPDMLAAVVGLGLMIMAGVASINALRSRMRRETWWVMHLYMYFGLALSFAHVLALGPTFVGHPVTQAIWAAVWIATAGTVILFRFATPLVRSLRHQLTVVEVRDEAPGVASIILKGKELERLAVSGGQFFAWRFLARGLWWQAHPYSLSALPRPPYLRLTVRQVGDHSAAIARLRPGTRVAIEGPYGAFTPYASRHREAVLVAAGIGITALRALLEDLPNRAKPVVIMRATSSDQLVLHDEVAALVRRAHGTLHEVTGTRSEVGSARDILERFVPNVKERDVYVCGPPGFVEEVVEAAHALHVARSSVHYEIFRW